MASYFLFKKFLKNLFCVVTWYIFNYPGFNAGIGTWKWNYVFGVLVKVGCVLLWKLKWN